MSKQDAGEFTGKIVPLASWVMRVVMNDNPFLGIDMQGYRTSSYQDPLVRLPR